MPIYKNYFYTFFPIFHEWIESSTNQFNLGKVYGIDRFLGPGILGFLILPVEIAVSTAMFRLNTLRICLI